MKHKTSKSLKFGEIKIAIEIEIEIYPFSAKIAEKIKIAFFFFLAYFFRRQSPSLASLAAASSCCRMGSPQQVQGTYVASCPTSS